MIVIAKMEVTAKNFGMMIGDDYGYYFTQHPLDPDEVLFYAFKPYQAEISNNIFTITYKTDRKIMIGSKNLFDGKGLLTRTKLRFPNNMFRIFSQGEQNENNEKDN